MTAYNGKLISTDPFILAAAAKSGTISGTVTSGGLAARRQILIYKGQDTTLKDQNWSDAADGSYSFALTYTGINDKYTVICKGEDGENDGILTDVSPIID